MRLCPGFVVREPPFLDAVTEQGWSGVGGSQLSDAGERIGVLQRVGDAFWLEIGAVLQQWPFDHSRHIASSAGMDRYAVNGRQSTLADVGCRLGSGVFPFLDLLLVGQSRVGVRKNLTANPLGKRAGVAKGQARAQGVAADKPALGPQLLADLLELLQVRGGGIMFRRGRCRGTAMPPKLCCNGAADLPQSWQVSQPLRVG